MKNNTVQLNNFGMTAGGQLSLGPFTVMTGANNIGKSLVTKALYSVLSASGENYFKSVLLPPLVTITNYCYKFPEETGNLAEIISVTTDLRDAARGGFARGQDPCIEDDIILSVTSLLTRLDEEFSYAAEFGAQAPPAVSLAVQQLRAMKDYTAQQWLQKGMSELITNNFINNFQTAKLKTLCADSAKENFDINIPGTGNFKMTNGAITAKLAADLPPDTHCVYLGSPAVYALAGPLAKGDKSDFFYDFERVPHVPKHFHDLVRLVNDTFTQTTLPPKLAKKFSEQIGGKISFVRDEFYYTDNNGREKKLSQSSMSVITPGIIGLLLEKNLLPKGSYLFLEDPEAHLHPAGQVALAKNLFDLAAAGVHVVLTTQSAEILKWLEVKISHEPEAQKLVALNHFVDKTITNERRQGISKQLDLMQEDLTEPYYQLFYQGMSEAKPAKKQVSANKTRATHERI